jgi:hypothetical protein
VFRK